MALVFDIKPFGYTVVCQQPGLDLISGDNFHNPIATTDSANLLKVFAIGLDEFIRIMQYSDAVS